MKTLQISSEGINYSAIDLGEFDNLMEYSYLHPKLKSEVKGKVFIGEFIKSTGTEISFQILPAKEIRGGSSRERRKIAFTRGKRSLCTYAL